MKIGVVISGGDVTGINNFIFQVARLAQADIVLFNGGIPGLLANQHHSIARRDLVDFSISSMPIISSGRTAKNWSPVNMKLSASNLKLCTSTCLLWPAATARCSF